MALIAPNFSCSAITNLSSDSITEEVWVLPPLDLTHERSIAAIAAIQILIMLIGIPWNSFVLLVILKKHLYKEPTFILLTNLVVTDLLVCVFVLPFNAASAITKGMLIGNSDLTRCQVCHTIVIIILCLIHVSLFTLAVMSFERLICLRFPFHYKQIFTVKKALLMMSAVWLFCFLISLPPVFGFGEIRFGPIISGCTVITRGINRVGPNVYYPIALALVALFPFITILVTDIWSLIIAYKHVQSQFKDMSHGYVTTSTDVNNDLEKKQKAKYQKKQIHLTKVFVAIFAVNVITWIPTVFIALVSLVIGAANVPYSLIAFQYVIFLTQPALHPMLETCLIGKATKEVFMCLCFCRKKKRVIPPGIATQMRNKDDKASTLSIITIVPSSNNV